MTGDLELLLEKAIRDVGVKEERLGERINELQDKLDHTERLRTKAEDLVEALNDFKDEVTCFLADVEEVLND
jgi:hypothetical protein